MSEISYIISLLNELLRKAHEARYPTDDILPVDVYPLTQALWDDPISRSESLAQLQDLLLKQNDAILASKHEDTIDSGAHAEMNQQSDEHSAHTRCAAST
jgi:hypothetical protein